MSNYFYGSREKVAIFTAKEIGNGFKRADHNEKISRIIAKIGEEHGDIGTPNMTQIFIHSEKCPSCKESLPIWRRITKALKQVLPTYFSQEIEYDKESDFNGMRITGREIYNFFKMSGIPFVLQNFEIVKRFVSDGSEYYAVESKKTWIPSYEGSIHPYGFLSKIFKTKNDFVESLSRY